MSDIFDLSQKVAIVTGASSGLGVQFAHALARKGAKVVVTARRLERLEQVEHDLMNQHGVEALAVECDVTKQEQIDNVIKQTLDKFGKIDILVNNAGVGGIGAAVEMDRNDWQKVIDVNLTAVFMFSQAVAKQMIKQKYGKIVNIASIFGKVGNLAFPVAAYHATKGGVVNLTRGLAAEWAKHNITVNAVGPGFFKSEMTQEVEGNEQAEQFITGSNPMHRWGEKGELDGAMIYLCSDASSFTTGQAIYVDGGWTAV